MTKINEKAITNVTASLIGCAYDKQKNNTKQEETDLLPDITPWSTPVDGVALANELTDTFNKYIYLPDGGAEVAAIWTLHTYISDGYMFTPRLFIHSPEPRCGKTTFLDLLEYLCYKSLSVSSITGPAMARMITIQKGQITLLADEADRYLNNDNDTLCKVLNSGFQRGKKIMCTETSGKTMAPRLFDCFAPCAIAGIGNIPSTVQDRSLTITLKRKTQKDRIEKLRYRDVIETTETLRRKCKRFIIDNEKDIINRTPTVPNELNDRTADVSEILFAIADTISVEWHKKLETAILKLTKTQSETSEQSIRVQLLSDIQQIFATVPKGWLTSNDLVEKLNDIETSPWVEWNRGHPMSTNALAKQLRFFGIYPRQTREEYYNRCRKYYRDDFLDAFDRYIPQPNCDTVTTQATHSRDCHTVTTSKTYDNIDVPF